MRPLNIKITGFGPYAGLVEIPMKELGEQGLYLITGITGAGKTTIFDAICYALYGSSSGGVREASMLRSNYADDDTPTEVELTFLHRGKEYTIRRNPDYKRKAKRGTGMSDQKADATLTMPDGSVITKTRSVNAKIEEILGINKDQFTQIAMIAQGDFLKLLHADTKERSAIFRKLFRTEPYQTLQMQLEEKRRETDRRVSDIRKSIDQHISGIKADPDDVLSIDADKAVKGELGIGEVLELLEKLHEKDSIIRTKLDAELTDIKKELETVNAAIGAAEALQKAKDAAAAARKALDEAEPEEIRRKDIFEAAKAALNERSVLEQSAAHIEAGLEDYNAADALRTETDALKESIRRKTEALSSRISEHGEMKKELEDLRTEQAGLSDAAAGLERLQSGLRLISEEENSLEDLQISLDVYKDKQDELERMRSEYKEKDEVFHELNEKYEAMDQAFRDGQAGILAQRLRDGERCPVCGSTSHPHPAPLAENVPTENELEKARKKASKARDDRGRCSEKISGISNSASTMAEELIRKASRYLKTYTGSPEEHSEPDLLKIAGLIDSAVKDCSARKEKINSGIVEETKRCRRKADLDGMIPANEKVLTETAADIEKLKNGLTADEASCKEKLAQLEKMITGLEYESRKAAEAEIERLRKRGRDLQAQYDKADNELKEQSAKVAGLKAAEESHMKTIAESKAGDPEVYRSKKEELDTALNENIERGKRLEARIRNNEEILANINDKSAVLAEAEKQMQWIKALADTASGKITGKTKIMLETYVQTSYFDRILEKANLRLMIMSGGQYEFKRAKAADAQSKSGLDLAVTDHYNGTERSVKTLSGGESFMASLSLALGLSDEVQSSAGGISIDTMFVDEGFGSLDPDSLDQAYRALTGITEGNKLVGIISHVGELKERIDKQIVVTKERTGGSCVHIQV